MDYRSLLFLMLLYLKSTAHESVVFPSEPGTEGKSLQDKDHSKYNVLESGSEINPNDETNSQRLTFEEISMNLKNPDINLVAGYLERLKLDQDTENEEIQRLKEELDLANKEINYLEEQINDLTEQNIKTEQEQKALNEKKNISQANQSSDPLNTLVFENLIEKKLQEKQNLFKDLLENRMKELENKIGRFQPEINHSNELEDIIEENRNDIFRFKKELKNEIYSNSASASNKIEDFITETNDIIENWKHFTTEKIENIQKKLNERIDYIEQKQDTESSNHWNNNDDYSNQNHHGNHYHHGEHYSHHDNLNHNPNSHPRRGHWWGNIWHNARNWMNDHLNSIGQDIQDHHNTFNFHNSEWDWDNTANIEHSSEEVDLWNVDGDNYESNGYNWHEYAEPEEESFPNGQIQVAVTNSRCNQKRKNENHICSNFNNKQYTIVKIEKRFCKTRDYCKRLGGRLAESNSEAEWRFIHEFVKMNMGSWDFVLIGHSDRHREGNWRTESGKESYVEWADNHPTGYDKRKNCAGLYGFRDFLLYEDSCNDKTYFLCEADD